MMFVIADVTVGSQRCDFRFLKYSSHIPIFVLYKSSPIVLCFSTSKLNYLLGIFVFCPPTQITVNSLMQSNHFSANFLHPSFLFICMIPHLCSKPPIYCLPFLLILPIQMSSLFHFSPPPHSLVTLPALFSSPGLLFHLFSSPLFFFLSSTPLRFPFHPFLPLFFPCVPYFIPPSAPLPSLILVASCG